MAAKTSVYKCQGDCGKNYERSQMLARVGNGEKEKLFCKSCAHFQMEKDEFSDYVCEKLGLIQPGPVIWSQRKAFLKQGYTHSQLMMVLRFLYDEKKISREYKTIGLIFSSYNEAKEFYEQEKIQQAKISQSIANLQSAQICLSNERLSTPVKKSKLFNVEEAFDE